jgi:ribosomal protein S27E
MGPFRRSNMTKFNCPHCGTRISAGAEDAGQKAPCPSCGGDIVVPDIAAPLPPAPKLPPPLPQAALSESGGANHSLPKSSTAPLSFTEFAAFFQKPQIRAFLSDRRRTTIVCCILGLLAFVFSIQSEFSDFSSLPPPLASAEDQFTAKMQGYLERVRNSPCQDCGGTGRIRNSLTSGALMAHPDAQGLRMRGHVATCRDCGGGGTIITQSGYVVACRSCGGRGMPESSPCPTCRGAGR